jgi:hypothetical protein
MTPAQLFEDLAASTWRRLADAYRLRVPQGETALTDHLLLEMARLEHSGLRALKTPIDEEGVKGTDWEWWIGTPRVGWLRYAVQAKRVTVASGRYEALHHVVGEEHQIDILRRYATANRVIPLYCFYNFQTNLPTAVHWHCERPLEPDQLGCSITPLEVVADALTTRGARSFDRIHRSTKTFPWRCLVRCPRFIGAFAATAPEVRAAALSDLEKTFGQQPVVYSTLPRIVDQGASGDGLLRKNDAFDGDFYDRDVGIYPRRILVADLEGSDDLGAVRLRA